LRGCDVELSVREIDGKLTAVVIDDAGKVYPVTNVMVGTITVTHNHSVCWEGSLGFLFKG